MDLGFYINELRVIFLHRDFDICYLFNLERSLGF